MTELDATTICMETENDGMEYKLTIRCKSYVDCLQTKNQILDNAEVAESHKQQVCDCEETDYVLTKREDMD